MSRYIFQRDGRPLLRWGDRAPTQSRGADTRALGSLGGTSLGGTTLSAPTLELPVPGGPEPMPMSGLGGDCGCSVKARCGCPDPGLGGVAETLGGLSTLQKVGAGVAIYLLYKHFKKRR